MFATAPGSSMCAYCGRPPKIVYRKRIPLLMQYDPKNDSSDSMLAPFLTAKSESILDELLRAIIDEHADPIIKKILRSKLRVSLNGGGTRSLLQIGRAHV